MTEIVYLKGDASAPFAAGPKFIVHVCNDLGGWGRGFVVALSKRWGNPETAYRSWARVGSSPLLWPADHGTEGITVKFGLGNIQIVQCERREDIHVVNMIAQHGIQGGSNGPPIRYDALELCLGKAAEQASHFYASVHMPRIGCGLAGGKWERVEPLIKNSLCARDIPVTVYDLE